MEPYATIAVTKEAYERLCDLQDFLEKQLGFTIPIGAVCSTVICQVELHYETFT